MSKSRVHVHFIAHEKVKEPAIISFITKGGPVAFKGHKLVKEPVIVDFQARKK